MRSRAPIEPGIPSAIRLGNEARGGRQPHHMQSDRADGPSLTTSSKSEQQAVQQSRQQLDQLQNSPGSRVATRKHVTSYLDLPSSLAALLMFLLLMLQFSGAVQPWHNPAADLFWVIWALFIIEFALKLGLSPDKRAYLTANAHHVLFVLVPMLAIVRLIDPARRLVVASIHLLLPASSETSPYIIALKRRGLGKLALISTLVILIGATLEYMFEAPIAGSPINSYGAAVWWSAATATTVANELYPVSTGGEVVAFLMMVYAVCVFGYLASALASVFVTGDAQADQPDNAQPAAVSSQADASSSQTPAATGNLELSDWEVAALRSILSRLEPE